MNTTMVGQEVTARPARRAGGDRDQCTAEGRVARSLLGYGIIAGPFYVAVSLAQAVTRDGFDLSRHEWSLLANGPGGWLQTTNLIVSGVMVALAAVGFHRVLPTGTGARWAPRLLAVYGAGLAAAGMFRADPMNGFPAGTPDGPPAHPSLHGTLHVAAAGVGFLALIAATWVLANRFRQDGHRRWSVFTRATGVLFLAAFAGIASGSSAPATNLALTTAVVLTWVWLSLTSARLYRTIL